MAAPANQQQGAATPLTAIFQTIAAGLGIISNREQDYSARNAYAQQRKGWEYAQNSQRLDYVSDGLQYLNTQNHQSTQTLLILSALVGTVVIAFALLHRNR